jgi:cytochrome b pre-mRNA-processing protein 3
LFAVLHRLKQEGPAGLGLAQELSDRFSEDMETVLREIGVGDITIPKKMRKLAASSGWRRGTKPSPPPSSRPCLHNNDRPRLQAGVSRTI